MKKLLIGLALLPSVALASPRQQLSLAVPLEGGSLFDAPITSAPSAPSRFQPAPTPNRDVSGPAAARASNQPTLAPTLFTNPEQFRGDGFSRGSTAQGEQERNLKPSAGFLLHMPLTPQ